MSDRPRQYRRRVGGMRSIRDLLALSSEHWLDRMAEGPTAEPAITEDDRTRQTRHHTMLRRPHQQPEGPDPRPWLRPTSSTGDG